MAHKPTRVRNRTRRLSFDGSGGDRLSGRLDLPDGEPAGAAVLAPCFTCTRDAVAAVRISRGLVDAGLAVLRFDVTGLGASGGDFAATTFSSQVEDLVRAATAARQECPVPQVLIGHSLGGAAALVGARRLPDVAAVVTVNAPSDPAHLLRHLPADALAAIDAGAEAVSVTIGGRDVRIGREFFADVSEHDVEEAVASLGRPLLLLHAPTDATVGLEEARRLFERARHPKSFVALDGADHLLSGRGDGAYAAALIAAWLGRYLPARPALR